MKQHHVLLFLLRCTVLVESSFCFLGPLSVSASMKRQLAVTLLRNHDDEDDEDETLSRGIPQLPASLSSFTASMATNTTTTTASLTSPVVGPKLQLQYTCQICDTRNVHQVSRIAYRQGMVIARCRGCSNQHLIADHHWGGFRTTSTTITSSSESSNSHKDNEKDTIKDIETYLQQQGKAVHRVSQQVFDLEQVWSVDTSSGSLIGDNGERNME